MFQGNQKTAYVAEAHLFDNLGVKIDIYLALSENPENVDKLTFVVNGPTGTTLAASFFDNEIWDGPEAATYTADQDAGDYTVVVTGKARDAASLTGALGIAVAGVGGNASSSVTYSGPASTDITAQGVFSLTATFT